MRLIDADELPVMYFDDEEGNKLFSFVPEEFIKNAPTIENEPIINTLLGYLEEMDSDWPCDAFADLDHDFCEDCDYSYSHKECWLHLAQLETKGA